MMKVSHVFLGAVLLTYTDLFELLNKVDTFLTLLLLSGLIVICSVFQVCCCSLSLLDLTSISSVSAGGAQ